MKNKTLEKWSNIIDTSNSGKSWLEQYTQLHSQNIVGGIPFPAVSGQPLPTESFPSAFPMAKQICAKTLGLDLVSVKPMEMATKPGKSEQQQLRQDRANKIRVIEGKEPDVELPNDIEISRSELFYIDYVYGNNSGNTQNNI